MLLVRVYCDLGLVETFDPRPYTRDWFLHRSEERYLGFLSARSREVREPGEGDIVLFRVGRCYAHGGIVTASQAADHHPRIRQSRCCSRGRVAAAGACDTQESEIRQLLGS